MTTWENVLGVEGISIRRTTDFFVYLRYPDADGYLWEVLDGPMGKTEAEAYAAGERTGDARIEGYMGPTAFRVAPDGWQDRGNMANLDAEFPQRNDEANPASSWLTTRPGTEIVKPQNIALAMIFTGLTYMNDQESV